MAFETEFAVLPRMAEASILPVLPAQRRSVLAH